jgi:hypothetical protein
LIGEFLYFFIPIVHKTQTKNFTFSHQLP